MCVEQKSHTNCIDEVGASLAPAERFALNTTDLRLGKPDRRSKKATAATEAAAADKTAVAVVVAVVVALGTVVAADTVAEIEVVAEIADSTAAVAIAGSAKLPPLPRPGPRYRQLNYRHLNYRHLDFRH